ncbi:RNA polymerase sigma factor [Fibrella aquatilis]|uniref:RNA polymerase sigma factor n=1 Tax=Fibrella aquatilis TaxID=2817059 RepID=A0A939G579_9BACT|nr:RNA polymerase sigma factor [Fibrella aquatilis]MBO0932344.1 RNA polymerase sigma factor [Fibrella aquatilis]
MNFRSAPIDGEVQLVSRLRQRDEYAFRWLYQHYAAALLRAVSKRITHHEQARDVLQDVFVKIWQHIDRYDAGKGRLYTWMLNVAQRTAIDALRTSSTQKQMGNYQHVTLNDDTTHVVDQLRWVLPRNPDHIDLRQQVNRLHPVHVELLELIYFNGYTQREAADQLTIPIGTVKTRLRTALHQLKQAF